MTEVLNDPIAAPAILSLAAAMVGALMTGLILMRIEVGRQRLADRRRIVMSLLPKVADRSSTGMRPAVDEIYRLALMLSREEFARAEAMWEKFMRYQQVLKDAPHPSVSATEAWNDYKYERSRFMDVVYRNLGVGFLRRYKARNPERKR